MKTNRHHINPRAASVRALAADFGLKLKTQPRAEREKARAAFLHSLFQEAAARMKTGATAKAALTLAARRRRSKLFPKGNLSRKRMENLLGKWRRNPRPDVFLRRYKAGKPRVPKALVEEFCSRLRSADPIVPAAIVFNSLRSDWNMGRALPGLGSWVDYIKRKRGEDAPRARLRAPGFPFTYRTLCRHLGRGYQQRAAAALRGQRMVSDYFAFLDACRNTLAAGSSHELQR